MKGIARAHTNIALIKYWGKADEALFLPMNSSLSLTLDAFYTDTKVVFDPTLTADSFYLNGIKEDASDITRFLNLFRETMNEPLFARVDSYNFVPTAAGLASSASAYAALAHAVNVALDLNLDMQTLSTYARRGSGSATRSIFGGFTQWEKGVDNNTSKAIFIDDASWDIGMVIIVVNSAKKAISSREGMKKTVNTSPFYPAWQSSAAVDLENMKTAIQTRNFQTLGEITEFNGMKMHATMLGTNPPICYFEPNSILAQQHVRLLREKGIPAYFTMDAGPNVKVLCRASDMDKIMSHLSNVFPKEQLIASLPGKGVQTLSQSEFDESVAKFSAQTRKETV
ncbi:diphosphomevalonate decarboxylase [Carnobacteriaceae bacterium zg-ZUI252]|nr:diphosphomevalonate decarboxylase [Carnobacteriaceae bacterium zg-ZUI252]QTU83136.1 diphosphomevalonate decarboxylase [Carnobacteriaceae bacterium zg-C25]